MEALNDNEKAKVMAETAKQFVDILRERIKQSQETLNILGNSWADLVPDTVKLHREEEAARLRAVITEQNSLLDIYTALFPL